MPGAGAVHHIRLGYADNLPGSRVRGRCSPDCMSFPEEATHPRYYGEGYPDWPGRASNKEGESWDQHSRAFVGIDASKLRNAVSVAEDGRGGCSLDICRRAT